MVASQNQFIISDALEHSAVPPADGSRAAALRAAYAERHLALPERLSDYLAALEEVKSPANATFWGRGFVLAGEAVGMSRVFGATPFWQGAVARFHQVVVEPVLRHAMTKSDSVTLAGYAHLAAPDAPRASQRDESEYLQIIDEALSDNDVMGRGFWCEAAANLYGAAWRSAELRAGATGPHFHNRAIAPEADPLLVRLMLQAEPNLPEDFRISRKNQRSFAVSQRKRSGYRPKEGGVAGIRVSSQIEDLPDAVLSELMLPPELMANRLLHEGLLVRHRPPFRQPKRDLLSVCLADFRETPDLTNLVKACWADAALRLRILLAQRGLEHSDLIWSERSFLGLSSNVMRVEDFDLRKGLDATMLEGASRKEALFSSGLLPVFTDQLGGSDPRNALEGVVTAGETSRALLQAGLERLQRRLRPGKGRIGGSGSETHSPEDYFRTIVFVVLSEQSETGQQALEDWRSVRNPLRLQLKPSVGEKSLLVGLVVPKRLAPEHAFTALGDVETGERDTFTPEAQDSEADFVNHVLGGVSALLIRTTMGAVNG
jgi:hypothetical protein